LVLALHGAGADAAGFAEETHFAAAGEARGVDVVFPDGTGSQPGRFAWNAGFCCGPPARQHLDDVGFIGMVIDDVARRTSIDRTRVYATGMSNGGMLAHRLAAEMPQRFAAIAAVSAAIGGTNRDGEPFSIKTPDRPVPVMIIHGRKDMYVMFDGGVSPVLGWPKRRNASVGEALEFWSRVDGCTSPPSRSTVGETLVHVAYGGCAGNAEVVLWELVQGEHAWPEGAIFPSAENGHMEDAAMTILDFFLRHRRE
jgi:polyhydroxybutyrate depolymerase